MALKAIKRPIKKIGEFLEYEASGGIMLMASAVLALIVANSGLSGLYQAFLDTPVAVQVGALEIAKPLLLWINDGLMAIFFLLVGLEIKREFLEGELSSREQALLPFIAAVGGMAVPAVIYAALNWNDPVTLRGWAIPAATDIAFALGILALLGSRAPLSLKVFLTAVAIIDDLGAIVIIAIFYTENLSLMSLSLAGIGLLTLIAMNRMGINKTAAYVVVGVFVWVCVLKSGIHATLAGVALALTIPMRTKDEDGHSLLLHMEHGLHAWVAFIILPVFGFANAGISFKGIGPEKFGEPVTLGIIAGLLLGKLVGIFSGVWLTVVSGLSRKPEGANWVQILGVACLCGIGFTMSLFIGALAFDDPSYAVNVRLGVLSASVIAAALGFAIMYMAGSKKAGK